jgi:hypothetical protein
MKVNGWFVFLRVFAGFGVAFLTPLAALFTKAAHTTPPAMPDHVAVIAALIGAGVGGLNAIIMFLDGSFTRWMAQPDSSTSTTETQTQTQQPKGVTTT